MKIGIITQKRKYVFETLFDTLGIPYEFSEGNLEDYDLVVIYGEDRFLKNSITIIDSSSKEPHIKQVKYEGSSFPIFFSSAIPEGGKIISVYEDSGTPAISLVENGEGSRIIVSADVIASAGYLLSLSYEAREEFKLLCRERPIVNDYMFLLLDLIKKFSKRLDLPLLQKWFWPKGEEIAVCLTHDIDILKHWWLQFLLRAFEMLKSGEVSALCRLSRKALNSVIAGRNPFLNFEKFVSLEREYGFKSSFFFLTDGGSLRDVFRNYAATYSLDEIKEYIVRLKRMEWDVGLHGSFHSYKNYEKLRAEKQKLQGILGYSDFGIRQHFLRIDIPETWQIQDRCGFLFDCTLTHPSLPGFRGSFSFPFYPYDEINNTKLNILEIPLTIMDRTFTKYKRELKPIDAIQKFFHLAKKSAGLITILWHNSSVDEGGFQSYFEIYKRILELIRLNKGYGVSPKELTQWWRRRRDLKLVKFKTNSKRTSWEFCSRWAIPFLTFKIYLPSKKFKRVMVDGAENSVEFLDGLIAVRIQDIPQDKVFSVRVEKE